MKTVLSSLLLIHALVHLLGGLRAFRPETVKQITQHITPREGAAWLLACALFLASFAFSIQWHTAWWIIAAGAVVVSQMLIFINWRNAKPGTILNIFIAGAIILAFAEWNFRKSYVADVKASTTVTEYKLLTESDIETLPPPVQKYIRFTHALNTPQVQSFRAEFSGRIRDYEKKQWMDFNSVQYNFLQSPARFFFLNAVMNRLPVAGYHRFANGTAFMDIRLLSLFTVQYEAGTEMNVAETVTFFNDMCVLAPATLIDRRIQWNPVDDHRTDAAFTCNGITIHASLFFNEEGALVNFISADRYARQPDGTMLQLTWSTPLKNYCEVNGLLLAGDAQAVYAYPDGAFCYGEFHLTGAEYNPVLQ